jgi:hypothetical protein
MFKQTTSGRARRRLAAPVAITTGTGADRMFGQDGNDTLTGDEGNDDEFGGDGTDRAATVRLRQGSPSTSPPAPPPGRALTCSFRWSSPPAAPSTTP